MTEDIPNLPIPDDEELQPLPVPETKRLEFRYGIFSNHSIHYDGSSMLCITSEIGEGFEHKHTIGNRPEDLPKFLSEEIYAKLSEENYEEVKLYSSLTDDIKGAPWLYADKNMIQVEGPNSRSIEDLLAVQTHLKSLLSPLSSKPKKEKPPCPWAFFARRDKE